MLRDSKNMSLLRSLFLSNKKSRSAIRLKGRKSPTTASSKERVNMTRVNMTTAEWLINAGNPTKWPQPVKKCTKNEYLDTVLEYEPEKVEYRTLLYNKRWRTARVEWFHDKAFVLIWPDTRVRVGG